MDELIRLLDENLRYDRYELNGEEIFIYAYSGREKAKCPYCGEISGQIHSRKMRTLKDLPIQGRKVKILLEQKKYFCMNIECMKKTFAERFDFYRPKATTTDRLQSEILRVALTQSSVAASRYLRTSIAEVSKSTICNMLKKGHEK